MLKHSLSIGFIWCWFFQPAAAQGIYSMSFTGLDNQSVSLNSGQNNRIIIVAFSAANPNKAQLQGLDSIYRNSSHRILVIGIPVNDFSAAPAASSLLSLLRDSMNVSYPIAAISRGSAGSGQHPLMQWLTTNSPKNHFKLTFGPNSQLFIIAPNGLLYAVLGPQTAIGGPDMQHILNNWPAE
jgi:glutathione peroxidase-family protein